MEEKEKRREEREKKGLFSVDPNFIVYEPDTRPETQEAAPPKIQFRF